MNNASWLCLTTFAVISLVRADPPDADQPDLSNQAVYEIDQNHLVKDNYSFQNNWREYAVWAGLGYASGLIYPLQPFSFAKCYDAYKWYCEKSKLPVDKRPLFLSWHHYTNVALAFGMTLGFATLLSLSSVALYKTGKFFKNNRIAVVPR